MTEDRTKNSGFDEIAADIEAGLDSGGDDKFWECAEHLLGEMHKNRRILRMADEIQSERRPPRMPMDPVDRLKTRIHEMAHDLADLPEDDRGDVFKFLLDEIESRLGPPALETLARKIRPRLA
jgi:hypothetical protein